jgi:phosphatidylserine synthase 2
VAPYLAEADTPFAWLYRPHTVTGLGVAAAAICYLAFFAPEHADDEHAAQRRGLAAVALVFLLYCSIQLRDSLLLRPHPIVWRLVHGAGVLYLAALVYMLMFPPEAGRRLLQVLYPELSSRVGPAENERLYATDCRIRTPGDPGGPFARVRENLLDMFVVAHAGAWLAVVFGGTVACQPGHGKRLG